jgi:hypothetical protein
VQQVELNNHITSINFSKFGLTLIDYSGAHRTTWREQEAKANEINKRGMQLACVRLGHLNEWVGFKLFTIKINIAAECGRSTMSSDKSHHTHTVSADVKVHAEESCKHFKIPRLNSAISLENEIN